MEGRSPLLFLLFSLLFTACVYTRQTLYKYLGSQQEKLGAVFKSALRSAIVVVRWCIMSAPELDLRQQNIFVNDD